MNIKLKCLICMKSTCVETVTPIDDDIEVIHCHTDCFNESYKKDSSTEIEQITLPIIPEILKPSGLKPQFDPETGEQIFLEDGTPLMIDFTKMIEDVSGVNEELCGD